MIKMKRKDIIDTLTQMRDDVIELYDCNTIYSTSLDAAIGVLKGEPVKNFYWADIY